MLVVEIVCDITVQLTKIMKACSLTSGKGDGLELMEVVG